MSSDFSAGTNTVSDSSASATSSYFHDIPSAAWYAAYVTELVDLGIVDGYKDFQGNSLHLFGPSDSVTYAQLAKLTIGTAGEPVDAGTGADWALPYLRRSKDLGYSVFTTVLDPNAPATRGAVVQTLLEALRVPMDAPSGTYRDVPASHPFAAAIATATRLGLVQGDTDNAGHLTGTFRPNASIDRAEMAKVLILARRLKK
jgi:hypothetical protein